MSTTPGVFTETTLLEQRNLADKMMMDNRIKQQFIPQMNVFNYIKSLQTATLQTAFNEKSKKDYNVAIHWMNACSTFDIDDVSCAIGGDEVSTNIETYTLDKRFVKGFSIKDEKFQDNMHDTNEAVAKALIRIDAVLAEEFSQYLVGLLNLYAGVNQVGSIAPNITVNGNITEIASALWTANLMGYMSRVAIMNRFGQHAFLTGANLYEAIYVAAANAANADGKGDFILWNKQPVYFDLFNIDSVNTPEYFTYLVSQGAVAIANKAWNPDAPNRNFHDIRYTMPSRFMSGIKYDVFYNNECKDDTARADVDLSGTNASDSLWHNYKIVLTADMYVNPEGCQADNSGILRFQNV